MALNTNKLLVSLIAIAGSIFAILISILLIDNIIIGSFVLLFIVIIASIPYHNKLSLILAITTSSAAFIFPGIPGRPYFWELAALGCWSGVLFTFVFKAEDKISIKNMSLGDKMMIWGCIGYCALLLFLVFYHGIGFNILGSKKLGGRFYFQQILTAIFPIAFLVSNLSSSSFIKCFRLGCILSLTFGLTDIALFFPSRASDIILTFFSTSTDMLNFLRQYDTKNLLRLQSLAIISSSFIALILSYVNIKKVISLRGVPWLFCIGILVFISFFSGHRLNLLSLGLMFIVLIIAYRAIGAKHILFVLMLGIVMILSLYAFAKYLPITAQRAVSFLPGIEIDSFARNDASGTLAMRRIMRERGMEMIPDYWLIGRGFGFKQSDLNLEMMMQVDYVEGLIQHHIAIGRFYNGIIGLLVNTGLLGTFMMLLVMIGGILVSYSILKEVNNRQDDALNRIAAILAAQFIGAVIIFSFFHGDSEAAMKTFGLKCGMLIYVEKMLRKTRKRTLTSKPQNALEPDLLFTGIPKLNHENATESELFLAMEAAPNRRSYVRLDAIRALYLGMDYTMVCRIFNLSKEIVHLWIYRFNKEGIDGLVTKPRVCRAKNFKFKREGNLLIPRIRDCSQARELYREGFKIEGRLDKNLCKKLGYHLGVENINEFNYNIRVPLLWVEHQDEEERKKYVAQLLEMESQSETEIWYADEWRIEGITGSGEHLRGLDSKHRSFYNGESIRINLIGAICPKDGRCFFMAYHALNAAVFQDFLNEFSKIVPGNDNRKRFLIVDNASWHQSTKFSWYQFIPKHLPAYSTDYNFIERLWVYLRSKNDTVFNASNIKELYESVFSKLKSVVK